MIFGLIGLGLSLWGASSSASAQKKAAKAEAKRLRLNAAIALREASAMRRAQLEEQHIRKSQARRALEGARVRLAKSGVMAQGTPLLVLAQAAEDMAMDIETISRERMEAIKRRVDQARLGIIQAGDVKEAGKLTSQATLIGGAGSAFLQAQSLFGDKKE